MSETFPICNYHAHTARCGHAQGTEEEYIRTAIDCGYRVLGFSDHTPWPYADGFVSPVRMRLDELRGYVDTLCALREKYAGQIKIRIGLECEGYAEYFPWLRKLREEYALQYFILGNHFSDPSEAHGATSATTPAQLLRYARSCAAAMDSGLFTYLCHPDMVFASYPVFDDACREAADILCQAANRNSMPLEYNLLGIEYTSLHRYQGLSYPCRDFWSYAAQYGCKAIVGVDAHKAAHLTRTDRFIEGQTLLRSLGFDLLTDLEDILP